MQNFKISDVTLFYQGIIDNHLNKFTWYECLARNRIDLSYPPFTFIKSYIKNGTYDLFTRKIIDISVDSLLRQQSYIRFSLNFDYNDIDNYQTICYLFDKVKKYNLQDRLIVEILENKIEDIDIVKSFVKDARKNGIIIAIDDFGNKHANINLIYQLEPDIIKINNDLTLHLPSSEKCRVSLKHIVNTCKELNIISVLEGIENNAIKDIVNKYDIDFLQGFYFSKPQEKICEKTNNS